MAIKKELIGLNGEKKEYFKIKKIVFDYEHNYFVIDCEVYTNEEYRMKAKELLQEIQMDEEIWYKLQDKMMKTQEEHYVLSQIDYGAICEAHRQATQYILKDEQIAVNVENTDIRNILYDLLKQTPQLEGAVDILENKSSLTEEEINAELEKRLELAAEKIAASQLPPPQNIEKDPNGGL